MTPSLRASARAAMLLANVRLTTTGRVSENVRARLLFNIRLKCNCGVGMTRGEEEHPGALLAFCGGQGNPDRAPFFRAWEKFRSSHRGSA
jgi:hypothetical protein